MKETIQKLKVASKKSNDKFLSKYEEKALQSPCENITIETWYEFVDIDSKYKTAIKELENLFKNADTKDPDDLKDQWNDLKDKWGGLIAGRAAKPNAKFSTPDGEVEMGFSFFKSLVTKKVKNHKVTKQDVKDAVKLLKNISREIDAAYKDFMSSNVASSYAYSTNRPGSIGLSKAEKYSKKLTNLKKNYMNLLERNYKGAIYWQLKTKQDQARLVIMKAASQKPVKESDIINEELDSIYEELIMKI